MITAATTSKQSSITNVAKLPDKPANSDTDTDIENDDSKVAARLKTSRVKTNIDDEGKPEPVVFAYDFVATMTLAAFQKPISCKKYWLKKNN